MRQISIPKRLHRRALCVNEIGSASSLSLSLSDDVGLPISDISEGAKEQTLEDGTEPSTLSLS